MNIIKFYEYFIIVFYICKNPFNLKYLMFRNKIIIYNKFIKHENYDIKILN